MPYSKETLNKHIAAMDDVGNEIGKTERKRTVIFDLMLDSDEFRYGPGLARLTRSLWSTLWKVVYVANGMEDEREAIEKSLKQGNAVSPAVNLAGLYPPRLVLYEDEAGRIDALLEYGVDLADIALAVAEPPAHYWIGFGVPVLEVADYGD